MFKGTCGALVNDTDNDRAHRGALASAAKQELERRIHARCEQLLTDAIAKSRTKDGLTGDEAKTVIATIGQMRLLLGDVNRDIQQGEEARTRLMAPSRN